MTDESEKAFAPSRPLSAEDREALTHCRLLDECGEAVINDLLPMCTLRFLAHGERLMDPAEEHTDLFVVVEGQLGVYLDSAMQHLVGRLAPGDCVGETAMLSEWGGTVYVVAQWPARLVAFPASRVKALMQHYPRIAINLIEMLSERLRQTNTYRLRETVGEGGIEFNATHDSVTGLNNRKWMNDMFERELVRLSRSGHEACLLLIDIDHFEKINQSVGRAGGDAVLKQLAQLIVRTFRPADLCARIHADRYAVLLPGSSLSEGVAAAERLRHQAAGRSFLLRGRLSTQLTLSIGAAGMADDLAQTLHAAEKNLAHAKSQGRNRVEPPAHD